MRITMAEFKVGEILQFKYKNYKEETSTRNVIPHKLWYGSFDGRKEHWSEDTVSRSWEAGYAVAQWFLDGYDLDRKAYRTFALSNIEIEIET